jgi:hypothetical protein
MIFGSAALPTGRAEGASFHKDLGEPAFGRLQKARHECSILKRLEIISM